MNEAETTATTTQETAETAEATETQETPQGATSEAQATETATTTAEAATTETTETTTTEETVGDDSGPTETTVDPNAYTVPKEVPTELRQWAAQNGFTDDQFKAALGKYQEAMQTMAQGTMQQLAKAGQELLKEWGAEKDTKLSAAKDALARFDETGEVRQLLKQTGYGNHPAVLKLFAGIGQYIQEGGFVEGRGAPRKSTKSMAAKLYPSMAKGD
jgi:hypothetical protein